MAGKTPNGCQQVAHGRVWGVIQARGDDDAIRRQYRPEATRRVCQSGTTAAASIQWAVQFR